MRWLLTLALLVAAPGRAAGEVIVDKIVVSGAKKTTRGMLEARMRLRPGDRIDLHDLDEARRRLDETGLFRSAEVTIDLPRQRAVELMYLDQQRHRVPVRVKVDEKLSWYVFPTAALGGGDYAVGALFAEQNLAGHGIQLLVAGQYGKTQSFGFAGLRLPYLGYLPITLSVSGTYRTELLPYYENHRRIMELPAQLAGGELEAGWVLIPNLRLLAGGRYRRQWVREPRQLVAEAEPPQINPRQGNLIDLRLAIEYDTTTAPEGLLRGTRFELKNQFAHPLWGSDYGFVRFDFELGLFGYLFKTYPSAFLRALLVSPISAGGIPATETLRLGGSALRGFQANEFHGDVLLALQLDEQVMLVRRFRLPWIGTEVSLAGALFVDTGALIERHPGGVPTATDPPRGPRFADLHIGIGGGLRLLLPGVAIPAIRIDVGYGVDVQDYAISFSIAGGSV